MSSNRNVARVQADYEALSNDLEQAHALTNSLEFQLSGKANELAQLKVLWERTRADMQKFEQDLMVVRRERHALANQVQRSFATERELSNLKHAHEELKNRAETMEIDLGHERTLHCEARRNIADLEREIECLRRRSGTGFDAEMRQTMLQLRKQLDRVLAGSIAAGTIIPTATATEQIDISFES